jgi:hypothetical protein
MLTQNKLAAATAAPTQTTVTPKFSFGASAPTNGQTPSMENVFGTKAGLSFADLATGKPLGFGGGFTSAQSSGAPLFGSTASTAPKPLFGSQTQTTQAAQGGEDGAEEGNDNPEEYEPQVDFKPLVKLSEVEVKTGEEDEEVMFKSRCKLFRFDQKTKEWKEKGVGDMKILRHRVKQNSYRVLMRREQVLKLCANHKITSELKLENMNEKQLRWLANDCSEGEPHPEFLAVKFKHEEDAKKFREEFEKAQKSSSSSATTSATSASQNLNTAAPIQNSLASLLKQDKGTWECTGCYTKNKENNLKCLCCQTAKPNTAESNDKGKIFYIRISSHILKHVLFLM